MTTSTTHLFSLIRECDRCHMVTAIDFEPDRESVDQMQMHGQNSGTVQVRMTL